MDTGLWFRAVRAPFLTATLVPVLVGTAAAWNITGRFNPFYFLLVLAGVACVHIGTNLANDYFDHRSGNDEANQTPTPFSGGSRVIQDGLLPAASILNASLLFFAAGGLIGLYLTFALGYVVFYLGIIGAFLGFFYTANPLRLGYTGIGELIVGIGFGPVVVLGSYYVQALSLSPEALLVSVPIALLIAMVLCINEFQDYHADKSVGKKTIVVRLGKKRALKLYHSMLGLAYAWIVLGALSGVFPVYALLVLLTIPLLSRAVKASKENYDKIFELLPANANTVLIHLFVGLMLSLAYVIDKVVAI